MITDTAHAKLNLALHVRRRREDGYHELESLFVFCADGDALSATPRDDGLLTLSVEGPFGGALAGEGEDNLVLRAARALQAAGGMGVGADIHLDKRLPIASGIGGGSADAAAALRLLARLWGIKPFEVDMFAIAASLGADVPACLGSQTVFGQGVGERLETVEVDVAGLPVLLVNPLVPCPTGPVFRAWDQQDRGPLDPLRWREGRNDLQPPAVAAVPVIADVLALLATQPGVDLVRMSGSGATCFALFAGEEARDAAAALVAADRPDWWVLATTLR